MTHADDLVRVGYFDQAWQLAEAVADRGRRAPTRQAARAAALEQFGRGVDDASTRPRNCATTDDEGYERFKRLCHAHGTAMIAPLAEALSADRTRARGGGCGTSCSGSARRDASRCSS